MKQTETEGLVLFSRPYREKDRLVKIFTEQYGKAMFLVRRGSTPNFMYKTAIQPLNGACYIARISKDGLSFLNSVKEEFSFPKLQLDFMRHSYATYMASLVNAAIEDHQPDPLLYGFFKQSLQYLNDDYDAEVILNIFELQMMKRFGVQPQFSKCAICGEKRLNLPFDYSSEAGGVICYRHFEQYPRRYHAHPRAVYFARLFQNIALDQIRSIHLSDETKQELRALIDQLYEEYIGLNLKSKQFIDKMHHASQALYKAQQRLIDKKKEHE